MKIKNVSKKLLKVKNKNLKIQKVNNFYFGFYFGLIQIK